MYRVTPEARRQVMAQLDQSSADLDKEAAGAPAPKAARYRALATEAMRCREALARYGARADARVGRRILEIAARRERLTAGAPARRPATVQGLIAHLVRNIGSISRQAGWSEEDGRRVLERLRKGMTRTEPPPIGHGVAAAASPAAMRAARSRRLAAAGEGGVGRVAAPVDPAFRDLVD